MENGQEINEVVNNFTDNIEEKRCPECGNRITDKMGKCPSCGYILKKKNKKKIAIVVGCYTGPKKLDPKSNDWRSVFLWLNIASNSKKRLLMLI